MTDSERIDWMEEHGAYHFFGPDADRPADERWFDATTDGCDYARTLRDAIDAAAKATTK